jgi:hypothetical protein
VRAGQTIRDAFRLARIHRPATLSRAPGSGPPQARGLATACPVLDAFSPPDALASTRGPGSRPRAPLPTGVTLLRASAPLADFCNLNTTRGHTLRAVDPRTRVELSPRYSPAPTDAGCVGLRDALPHREPASRDLYTLTCVQRVPLARTRQVAGRSVRAKASARSWTMSRVPFSWRFGHPGHRLDPSRRLEDLRDSSRRPRPPSDASPRRVTPSKRSGCLLPRWNPYASGGLLLRARLDRGPVTPPPQRHCSGARTPFSPFPQRLPLTNKALEPARPTEPWEPKPRWNDQSQRPSRLLRPNQLAG